MSEDKAIDRQELFAIEFVVDFNGTRAAARVGYTGTDEVLAVTASRLLRTAKVRNRISELLESSAMAAGEALWRLAAMARVDISEFIKSNNDGFSLNWANIRKYGFLIKSITNTKYGVKLELYDGQRALELIAKHLGLFTDRIDVTTQGQSLESELSARLHKIYEAHKAKENQEDQD